MYPLERAARMGYAGGPCLTDKGDAQPNYLVSDTSGVHMPHYQRDSTNEVKLQQNGNNPGKNRLGFVW